jgi:hypothetical protein
MGVAQSVFGGQQMGYYTFYTLTAYGPQAEVERLRNADPTLDPSDPEFRFSTVSDEHMKWYESERDVKALSKHFPKLTFVLTGEGEDSEDKWKAKFRDGKMTHLVRASIMYRGWREPSAKSWTSDGNLRVPGAWIAKDGNVVPMLT